MKNGIPFDVAEALDDSTRLAYMIAFGEMEGGDWDWTRMEWIKRD